MSSIKNHFDKTSAETKTIGFDYQYYFFLWKVLCLEDGQSVGLEIKDDVHTELDNNTQILYQLKHTISTQKDGKPANLTTLDKDIWKTLSNCVQVIQDAADGRSKKINQLEFIHRTSFVLATNKSSSKSNKLINGIDKFQNGTISVEEFRTCINELLKSTDSKIIKEYITRVIKITDDVLAAMLG